MEFKIDTKSTYTVITPIAGKLDVNMAGQLEQKVQELTNNGSINFIIDLQHCTEADNTSLETLTRVHESCYNNNISLVFTGLKDNVAGVMKNNEEEEVFNIAPTMIEAVDIISMEILERDLLSEE